MSDINNEEKQALTMEELQEPLTTAERKEMDNPAFLHQFTMYVEGMNKIPNLSKEQRYCMTESLRDHVRQRTAVNEAIIDNPDISKTVIDPVVIIGMARSGTTMLHRLLSCDPRFVAPMAFELLQPCPPGRPENWRGTERYRKAQEYMSHIYPTGVEVMSHIHEINLDKPDECYFILQAALIDGGFGLSPVFNNLKKYMEDHREEISTSAYEYYKKALQCIFYNGLKNGEVPLLKSPVHTGYIDTYRKMFPTARFIFPFRNAREMVASSLSLLKEGGPMMGFEYDQKHYTGYSLELIKWGSSKIMEAIKTTSKELLYCVSYSEMVKDPLAVVKEIYTNFGWEVTPQMMENMQSHLQENKQHKLGKHVYNLEEFGATEEDLKDVLSEYIEYFGEQENIL